MATQQHILQVPITQGINSVSGRKSRYSKTLPEIPGFDAFAAAAASTSYYNHNTLPPSSWSSAQPATAQAEASSSSSSDNTTIPPRPPQKETRQGHKQSSSVVSMSASGPPKMVIVRKAVGASSKQQQQQQQQQTSPHLALFSDKAISVPKASQSIAITNKIVAGDGEKPIEVTEGGGGVGASQLPVQSQGSPLHQVQPESESKAKSALASSPNSSKLFPSSSPSPPPPPSASAALSPSISLTSSTSSSFSPFALTAPSAPYASSLSSSKSSSPYSSPDPVFSNCQFPLEPQSGSGIRSQYPAKPLPLPKSAQPQALQRSGTSRSSTSTIQSSASLSSANLPWLSLSLAKPESQVFKGQNHDTQQTRTLQQPTKNEQQEKRTSLVVPDTPPSSAYLNVYTDDRDVPELQPKITKSLNLFLDTRVSSELSLPLKSPSESLSSIFSAYSHSPIESTHLPLDGTAGTQDTSSKDASYPSAPSLGPPAHILPTSSKATAAKPAVRDKALPPSPPVEHVLPRSPSPPAPPSKDSEPTAVRRGLPSRPNQNLGRTQSPPREQLWRRRSVKGSRELPSLKVDIPSHDSPTPASIPAAAIPAAIDRPPHSWQESSSSTVSVPPRPPPKGPVGLPGRNIRPTAPTVTAENGVGEQTMGNKGSKVKEARSNKLQDERYPTNGNDNRRHPPTPEYQKEDIKTPIIEKVIRPESPASSPELPDFSALGKHSALTSNSLTFSSLSTMQPAKPDPKPIKRKAIGTGSRNNSISLSAHPLNSAKSLPNINEHALPPKPTDGIPPVPTNISSNQNMNMPHGPEGRASPVPFALRAGNGTNMPPPHGDRASPIPQGQGLRSVSGRDSPGPRQRNPSGSHPRVAFFQHGMAGLSRPQTPSQSRPQTPSRMSGSDVGDRAPDLWVRTESGELLYRGRDGTLYPEMKQRTDVDHEPIHFPKQNVAPITEGTIFSSAPVKQSHYQCYQKHRSMVRRQNRKYPLTCHTCNKSDDDWRWACTFCSLRVCESCLSIFNANKRNLATLVEAVASKQGSLGSEPRPAHQSNGLDMRSEA